MPFLPMLEGWQVYDYTAVLMLLLLASIGIGLLIVWAVDSWSILIHRIKNGKNK